MPEVTVLWTPDWHKSLFEAVRQASTDVLLVSPWLKLSAAELIVNALFEDLNIPGPSLRLLTTFDEEDFIGKTRASDLEAYLVLVGYGFTVHVVRGLHAKIYLCDGQDLIVSSGNLTSRGLGRNAVCNLEIALHVRDEAAGKAVLDRITPVWESGQPLTPADLKAAAERLHQHGERDSQMPRQEVPAVPVTAQFGTWWRGRDQIKGEAPIPLTIDAAELLSSLNHDPALSDAMLIASAGRQSRARGARRRKPVSPGPAENHQQVPVVPPLPPVPPPGDQAEIEGQALPDSPPGPADVLPDAADPDETLVAEIDAILPRQAPPVEPGDVAKAADEQAAEACLPAPLGAFFRRFLDDCARLGRADPLLVAHLSLSADGLRSVDRGARFRFLESLLLSGYPVAAVRWLLDSGALSALGFSLSANWRCSSRRWPPSRTPTTGPWPRSRRVPHPAQFAGRSSFTPWECPSAAIEPSKRSAVRLSTVMRWWGRKWPSASSVPWGRRRIWSIQ
jgi:hypothetical protein